MDAYEPHTEGEAQEVEDRKKKEAEEHQKQVEGAQKLREEENLRKAQILAGEKAQKEAEKFVERQRKEAEPKQSFLAKARQKKLEFQASYGKGVEKLSARHELEQIHKGKVAAMGVEDIRTEAYASGKGDDFERYMARVNPRDEQAAASRYYQQVLGGSEAKELEFETKLAKERERERLVERSRHKRQLESISGTAGRIVKVATLGGPIKPSPRTRELYLGQPSGSRRSPREMYDPSGLRRFSLFPTMQGRMGGTPQGPRGLGLDRLLQVQKTGMAGSPLASVVLGGSRRTQQVVWNPNLPAGKRRQQLAEAVRGPLEASDYLVSIAPSIRDPKVSDKARKDSDYFLALYEKESR